MKNFRFIAFTLITILFSAGLILPQQNKYPKNSPEWLVYRFFAEKSFPDKQNYYTGEMVRDVKNPSIGEELNGNGEVTIKKILQQPITSAFAVTIRFGEKETEFYCYLLNVNRNWKIQAIRKFQLPRFIYQSVDSLSQISSLPDSTQSLLSMLKLITSNDDELENYFKQNETAFKELLTAFQSKDKSKLLKLLNRLSVNSIYKDKKIPGCTFVQIGGFETAEVGYIFTVNRSSLPKISPERFIIIEEILPNWYLYRQL